MIDVRHLIFARKFLLFCAESGIISWRRYNWLMKSVAWHEGRVVGCEGKAAFESFEIAMKVTRRHARDHQPRKVYPCQVCGKFHIAHMNRRQAQRKQEIEAMRELELRDA